MFNGISIGPEDRIYQALQLELNLELQLDILKGLNMAIFMIKLMENLWEEKVDVIL